jgi:hypothetical protein
MGEREKEKQKAKKKKKKENRNRRYLSSFLPKSKLTASASARDLEKKL